MGGLSLRDQRDSTVRRVMDQYQQTGSLPGTLVERLIDEEYRLRWREGGPMPRDAVERHVHQWAADLLAKLDKKEDG